MPDTCALDDRLLRGRRRACWRGFALEGGVMVVGFSVVPGTPTLPHGRALLVINTKMSQNDGAAEAGGERRRCRHPGQRVTKNVRMHARRELLLILSVSLAVHGAKPLQSPQRVVPVIDISPLRSANADQEARRSVVQQIGDACMEVGFFYVTGHGVSEQMQRQLEECSRAYMALPRTVKRKIAMADAEMPGRGKRRTRSSNPAHSPTSPEARGPKSSSTGQTSLSISFGHRCNARLLRGR